MRGRLLVSSPLVPDVALRSVAGSDQKNLRAWKNKHRRRFFQQDRISVGQQGRWYQEYLERSDDAMFMVEVAGDVVGCMGVRRLESGSLPNVDVYNIIRGRPSPARPGAMAAALRLLCSWAALRMGAGIGCKVLEDNPAVVWYERCGFRCVDGTAGHLLLAVDWSRMSRCLVEEQPLEG